MALARQLYPIAFALGAAAACGFAPLSLWPLTIECLAGLLALAMQARTPSRAFGLGWWFGLGQFCVGLNWIATAFTFQAAMPAWLGWVAVVLLALYLAVFPAIGLLAAWLCARRVGGLSFMPFAAAGWIGGEFLRASLFTGFAWNPLAAIWVPGVLPVARATVLLGTYGLSGLTVLLAGAAALAARKRWKSAAILATPLVLAFALGIRGPAPVNFATPTLRIVQPNINQNEKWAPGAEQRNFARLVALTGPPEASPRLILWPEVAVPWYLDEDPAARATIARLLGPADMLLTGAIAFRYDRQGRALAATNSLFGLDAAGRLLGRYDKSHLVPYGEYLPMRPILSRLGLSRLAPGDMDFDAGPGAANIVLPGIGPVGVQICYEIIFSGRVVDRAHRPRFLFNPSNDAWFGAWGPPQHLAQARLRAIEEGVPVVRATPTGISAVIDAQGRMPHALGWHQAGAISAALPSPAAAATPFARIGNLAALVVALLLAALGFATGRRGR